MSTAENTAICRRFADEVINQGNLDAVDDLFASNHVNHQIPAGQPQGPEGEKLLVSMFRQAFPDGHLTIEDVVAEGDKVVARSTYRGTHQGEFMGVPPTDKRVSMSGISLFRLENGRIAENWGQLDMLGLLQQLGVIPAPSQAGG